MLEREANRISTRPLLVLGTILAALLGPPVLALEESSPATAAAETVATDNRVGPHLRVTYLANEGFLLQSGEQKLLIDALFPGIRNYPRVTGSLREDLLAARPPFSGIKVALASHHHDDHFGPTEALTFLATSLETVLIATPQAIARFDEAKGWTAEIGARVRGIYPAEGRSTTVNLPGISIEILNLHHGRGRRPWVENLGFLIDVNGFRVLHVGDTEATVEDFRPYDLPSRSIDLAILPGWFLAEPNWVAVSQSLGARNIAAMHLAEESAPPSWFGSSKNLEGRLQLIRTNFPDAWIPRGPLDSRVFGLDTARSDLPR